MATPQLLPPLCLVCRELQVPGGQCAWPGGCRSLGWSTSMCPRTAQAFRYKCEEVTKTHVNRCISKASPQGKDSVTT